MAICLRRALALGLAHEAVIRPLTNQPEVTEELVVTASDELRISRSLVYRLVAKFRTAAAGFANRSGVLILALCTDNHPRAPAKFQRIGAVYDVYGKCFRVIRLIGCYLGVKPAD